MGTKIGLTEHIYFVIFCAGGIEGGTLSVTEKEKKEGEEGEGLVLEYSSSWMASFVKEKH